MQLKDALREKFNGVLSVKENEGIRMSKELGEHFSFIEYSIKKDLQTFNLLSFAICGAGRRNYLVRKQFQNAISACTTSEKIQYYSKAVQGLTERGQETSIKILQDDWQVDSLEVKLLKGIKIKGNYKIQLKTRTLDCNHFQIDLTTYLLRKSKKDKNVFCLQTVIEQEPTTIRFELVDPHPEKQACLKKMGAISFRHFMENLNKSVVSISRKEIKLLKPKPADLQSPKNPIDSKVRFTEPLPSEEFSSALNTIQNNIAEEQPILARSLIEELVGNEVEGNLNEEVYEYLERKVEEAKSEFRKNRFKKLHKNRLALLLPGNFNLSDMHAYNDYSLEVKLPEKRVFIYYSKKTNSFKLEMNIKAPKQKVLEHMCQAQSQKLWNSALNESQVKWAITSQNAYIFYRKQKSLSQWYRERDFLFIRYLFKKGDSHFIIDRSIENPHFIPFQSIQRSYIHHCIYQVQDCQDGVSLLVDFHVQYEGLLTSDQKKTMTLAYLRQYANLEEFILNFNGNKSNQYDLNWEIEDSPQNLNNISSVSISSAIFQQPLEDLEYDLDDEQSFYSIIDEPVQIQVTEREVAQKKKAKQKKKLEVRQFEQENIALNAQGLTILPFEYLKVKHVLKPVFGSERRMKMDYSHIMLKNDFRIDEKGGIVLFNQTKIAAQNNVIKFVMSSLKKNLFSGKGILSLSLPVQIFSAYSNIQKMCEAMALAPDLIEKGAVLAKDKLQRFCYCIAFAVSNSVIYFDIDKPFNPILGQTFQGFIDGCPVYAQQISHHPPISSLLLYGRGYRVYANLQAKVYIHLNSGEGINEGLYTIEFDDGQKVCFQTAPGEVSGLAVGDRKYRIKGKMAVLDPKNRLYSIVNFQDQNGYFSKNKWKFSDQMEGPVCKVTQGYIRNFFASQNRKQVVGPTKKQIEEIYRSVSGRWVESLLIDSKTYYNISQTPHQLVHYQYPLQSNSNYREDLIYRKMDDLARSQQEKQRLQIFQRGDKKLREKYNGKQH